MIAEIPLSVEQQKWIMRQYHQSMRGFIQAKVNAISVMMPTIYVPASGEFIAPKYSTEQQAIIAQYDKMIKEFGEVMLAELVKQVPAAKTLRYDRQPISTSPAP